MWLTMDRQCSLYVPQSGHYMYRTVVTIYTAQWSLYVPPVWHSQILRSAHTAVFICFVWISEQTAIISLYNINWLVCITETECVYCAVRTGYLKILQLVNLRILTGNGCGTTQFIVKGHHTRHLFENAVKMLVGAFDKWNTVPFSAYRQY